MSWQQRCRGRRPLKALHWGIFTTAMIHSTAHTAQGRGAPIRTATFIWKAACRTLTQFLLRRKKHKHFCSQMPKFVFSSPFLDGRTPPEPWGCRRGDSPKKTISTCKFVLNLAPKTWHNSFTTDLLLPARSRVFRRNEGRDSKRKGSARNTHLTVLPWDTGYVSQGANILWHLIKLAVSSLQGKFNAWNFWAMNSKFTGLEFSFCFQCFVPERKKKEISKKKKKPISKEQEAIFKKQFCKLVSKYQGRESIFTGRY